MLRHPRSRIRIAPGWRAPSLNVELPSLRATVFVSRHRVTPGLWHKVLGTPAPDGQSLFLVTLSALGEVNSSTGSIADATVDVHSLFRGVVGGAWTQQEQSGSEWEWTWHCLMTNSEIEGPLPAKSPRAA